MKSKLTLTIPSVSITSQFVASEHTTVIRSTISAGPSGTGTILIDPPNNYSVIYTYSDEGPSGSAAITSTILPSGTVSGTFIITRPYRYITQTTTVDLGYSATGPVTSTITPNPSNTVGTVLIQSPAGYVTSTIGTDEGPSGTVTTFSTRAASNGSPPTYYVETPYPYSTFTTSYDAGVSGTVIITSIVSVTNSRFGSVIVSTPGAYITITTGYDAGPTGGSTITSVTPATSNTDGRGTVRISTPYPYITPQSYTDIGPTGSVSPSTSIISASTAPGNTGTLISIVADRYGTTTVPYQGSGVLQAPITTTIRPSSGGTIGTVQIQTQAPPVTSFTGYDAGPAGGPAITSTSTGPGVAPTIFISTADTYVTTTSPGLSTTAFRSTVHPSGTGTVGSVVVFTPSPQYTTLTTYWGQSTSSVNTSSSWTGGSSKGTIVDYVPATNAAVATNPPVSIIARATGASTTASQTLPNQPTGTAGIAAPSTCNNQGFDWAEYPNTSGDWSRPGPNNNPPGYINFKPEVRVSVGANSRPMYLLSDRLTKWSHLNTLATQLLSVGSCTRPRPRERSLSMTLSRYPAIIGCLTIKVTSIQDYQGYTISLV